MAAGQGTQGWALLPARWRDRKPPRWWQEVAFLAVGYWSYGMVRNGVPTRSLAALTRAVQVENFQNAIGLGIERTVNAFVAGTAWLAIFLNYFYATAHFIVTIAVLLWLYRRHPHEFRPFRTALYSANFIALAGYYLYPLAPPRMLDGYTDTVVTFHTWGSWGSANIASASNQFAAMPSMHFGWALWCGIVLYRLGGNRILRGLGLLYPCLTLFAIVGTANHFWIDAAAGAVVLAMGFGVQRLLTGAPALVRAES